MWAGEKDLIRCVLVPKRYSNEFFVYGKTKEYEHYVFVSKYMADKKGIKYIEGVSGYFDRTKLLLKKLRIVSVHKPEIINKRVDIDESLIR